MSIHDVWFTYPPNITTTANITKIVMSADANQMSTKLVEAEKNPNVKQQVNNLIAQETQDKTEATQDNTEATQDKTKSSFFSKYFKLSVAAKKWSINKYIESTKSNTSFDACDKETYIIYLNHFKDLSNNFTKARYFSDEGYAFSTDYGLLEMFKKEITKSLEKIVPDPDKTEYLILNKEKFYELFRQNPPNYRSILIKMRNIEKMNNIEFSKISAITLNLIQLAMFFIDKTIKIIEKIGDSDIKKATLVLAKYLLLRFRIIYGTSGKGSCQRITNLLSGITKDFFGNSFKVNEGDSSLTNKTEMDNKCDEKFSRSLRDAGTRIRCKSLVQSRINFNDVLDISCNLKPKSQLITETSSNTTPKITSVGGRKNFTKRIKSMKNKRNIKKRRRTKKKYNGGDAEMFFYDIILMVCGAGLMGSDAASMGMSGGTVFNIGAACMGLSVLIMILISNSS